MLLLLSVSLDSLASFSSPPLPNTASAFCWNSSGDIGSPFLLNIHIESFSNCVFSSGVPDSLIFFCTNAITEPVFSNASFTSSSGFPFPVLSFLLSFFSGSSSSVLFPIAALSAARSFEFNASLSTLLCNSFIRFISLGLRSSGFFLSKFLSSFSS